MTLAALLLFEKVVVGDSFSLLKPLLNVIRCLIECKMNSFVTLTYYLKCYFISRPLALGTVQNSNLRLPETLWATKLLSV